MKNNLFFLKNNLIALFFATQAANLAAQNMDYRSTLSGAVGPNYIQLLGRTDKWLDLDSLKFGTINTYGKPTWQGAYDFALNDWFSLGVAATYNRVGVEFGGLDYHPNDSLSLMGDFDIRVSRTTIVLRPLFHYGHFEKIDMYSGLRIGASVWTGSIKGEGSVEAFEFLKKDLKTPRLRFSGVVPTAALTLYGIRYYPIPNVGIGAELNVGSPYMASASVNFRF